MRGERGHSAALMAACVTAAIVACWGDLGGDRPERQNAPLNVPRGWQLARLAPGHAVHVGKERVACEQCHTLDSGSFEDPGPQPCAACHAKEARIQHARERAQAAFGASAQADCTDCHAFAAATVATPPPAPASVAPDAGHDAAWDCGRCHDGHRSDVTSGTAVVAHRGAACSACHTPHGDSPATPADCASCHAAVQLTHGHVERGSAPGSLTVVAGSPGPLEARCRVCHQGLHEPAAQSRQACVDCHSTTAPIVAERALFAGGHERCTSCHAPHDFEPDAVVPCASCHQTHPPALAAARVKAHADCESCHRPHDARADAAASCASCHARLENDHPAPPGASECTSCHVAHPADSRAALHASIARLPCGDCHAGAGGDGGFHAPQVACRECHVPHRFELAATDLAPCERCHAAPITRTRALGPGHASCRQCHAGLPHDTTTDPPACETCHARQSAHANAGHRACQGCHEPHGGEVKASCTSCHAPVLAGAPAGHRACQSCHESHSGVLAVAGCASCHEAKAQGPHRDVQGGCGTCHSAHGPAAKTPPACTSCHDDLSREGGLHAVAQHGRCSDCHRAHDAQPRPQPETCRSCHRDRAQHYPDARRCSGCHLFESL